MTELLKILIEWLGFLYRGGRYRLVDSCASESFGGDAMVTLASDTLRWRLVRDRGQVFLDCQPTDADPSDASEWFSTDLLRRFMSGERVPSAELDEGTASWVAENLREIERRFSEAKPQTLQALRALEQLRAKELFG